MSDQLPCMSGLLACHRMLEEGPMKYQVLQCNSFFNLCIYKKVAAWQDMLHRKLKTMYHLIKQFVFIWTNSNTPVQVLWPLQSYLCPQYIWSANPPPADVHFISVSPVCHYQHSELCKRQLRNSGSNTYQKKNCNERGVLYPTHVNNSQWLLPQPPICNLLPL